MGGSSSKKRQQQILKQQQEYTPKPRNNNNNKENINKTIKRTSLGKKKKNTKSEGLDYQQVHDSLTGFFETVDPKGLESGEIEVKKIAKWVVSTGSLNALNRELESRYGFSLASDPDEVDRARIKKRLPSLNPASSMQSFESSSVNGDDNDTDSVDLDELEEMREKLESFFLFHDPSLLGPGVEDMLCEYRLNGKVGVNVYLYNQYQQNLDTFEFDGRKKRAFSIESIGKKIHNQTILAELQEGPKLHTVGESNINRLSKNRKVTKSLDRKWKHVRKMSTLRAKEKAEGKRYFPEEQPNSSRISMGSDASVSSAGSENQNICKHFVLDLSAPGFAECKNCGQAKRLH